MEIKMCTNGVQHDKRGTAVEKQPNKCFPHSIAKTYRNRSNSNEEELEEVEEQVEHRRISQRLQTTHSIDSDRAPANSTLQETRRKVRRNYTWVHLLDELQGPQPARAHSNL